MEQNEKCIPSPVTFNCFQFNQGQLCRALWRAKNSKPFFLFSIVFCAEYIVAGIQLIHTLRASVSNHHYSHQRILHSIELMRFLCSASFIFFVECLLTQSRDYYILLFYSFTDHNLCIFVFVCLMDVYTQFRFVENCIFTALVKPY